MGTSWNPFAGKMVLRWKAVGQDGGSMAFVFRQNSLLIVFVSPLYLFLNALAILYFRHDDCTRF